MLTKRERMIGVVLLILTAVWLGKIFPKPQGVATPSRAHHLAQEVPESVPPQRQPVEHVNLEEIVADLRSKTQGRVREVSHDPFAEFIPETVEKKNYTRIEDLSLAGIVMVEGEPLVLINDEILWEGDDISGFLIEEIRDTEVLITRGVERYKLKIFRELNESQ